MRMRKKKLGRSICRLRGRYGVRAEGKRGKWRALFGNDNPIHLEIGCGKGRLPSAWPSSTRM